MYLTYEMLCSTLFVASIAWRSIAQTSPINVGENACRRLDIRHVSIRPDSWRLFGELYHYSRMLFHLCEKYDDDIHNV